MKKLIQLVRQTVIYGIATVFPRVISVLLVRLHTDKQILENVSDYGNLSLIFSYIILFNVILSYGLETSFFRFFNKESNKKEVLSTSSISIVFTTILFYFISDDLILLQGASNETLKYSLDYFYTIIFNSIRLIKSLRPCNS